MILSPHSGSCTVGEPDNGYFHKTCTQLDVSVDVAGGWTAAAAAAKRVRIRYTSAANGNPAFTLSNPQNMGGTPTVWRYSGTIDVTQAQGNYDLYLRIDENGNQNVNPPCNGANPCQSGVLHRTNAAAEDTSNGPDAGTIEQLDLYEGTGTATPTLSNGNLPTGQERTLAVEIGVSGHLELADPSDPPVSLKVAGQNQTQGLDCDDAAGTDFDDEVANGCAPTYVLNTGQVCDPDLSPASALWASAQPWPCVAVATGQFENKANKGLNIRVLCKPANSVGNCKINGGEYDGKPASCTNPNNWPNFTPDDPRIVSVFVTPADSFEGNGSQSVPIINFASFYVTGWSGSGGGFTNPCEGDGDEPDPIPDGSNVYGHWIKYVLPNTGGGTGEACDFSNVGSCVAVMTK